MAMDARDVVLGDFARRHVTTDMVSNDDVHSDIALRPIASCSQSWIIPRCPLADWRGDVLSPGSESYAIFWNMLHKTQDGRFLDFGTKIHFYRFRRGDVSVPLSDGSVYEGTVRVGIERSIDFQSVSADKLPVVLYDKDLNVLAKVASYDWAAESVRRHIGDKAVNAMLFCEGGGTYHSTTFLYMVVVWNSDLHPYKKYRGHHPERPYRHSLNYFIRVTVPEAVSDLTVGEHFDAALIGDFGKVGLTRLGKNYRFADLPDKFGDALAHLVATGYPEFTLPCVSHGSVRRGDDWTNLIEVLGINADEVERLAHFRRESSLDVRFDWTYETLRFESVDSPYDIPFGVVEAEYVAVPIPKRKNPLVELRVNGVTVQTARYRESRNYEHFKSLVGMKSVWARLHYDEKDAPYLNVIWSQGEEAD